LVRRDSLLVLDLGFDIVDRIGWFHIQSDRLAYNRRTYNSQLTWTEQRLNQT
jgi:hypothetical protein